MLFVLAALALAGPSGAATAPADSTAASLAPSSAPPWNPPRPIGPSEPWEAVVRFPGRLVSLPLAALGQGTRKTLLAAEQGFSVQRFLYFFRGVPVPFGVGPAGLGDRTGFGAGAVIRPSLGLLHVQGLFDVSTRGYTRARLHVASGFAMAEYRIDRRPAERFFGLGMASSEDDESRYGLTQERVVAGIGAASPLRGHAEPLERFTAWIGPRWSRTTQGYGGDERSITEVFPGFAGTTLDHEIEHLTYGAELAFDHRGGAPHWTRGWSASASAERFDRPLVASPARTGARFTRYTYLAEAGTSFMRDPRSLRLTLTVTDNELDAGADRFLVSDLARLGGANGLAGYEPHRFHDLDAMNLRAAYVFPVSEHLEFDVHGDAGGTFASLQDDFRPNRLRQSAGFALRARSAFALLASLGFDFSPEAARFVFAMGAEP
jgi:hypothetical protein